MHGAQAHRNIRNAVIVNLARHAVRQAAPGAAAALGAGAAVSGLSNLLSKRPRLEYETRQSRTIPRAALFRDKSDTPMPGPAPVRRARRLVTRYRRFTKRGTSFRRSGRSSLTRNIFKKARRAHRRVKRAAKQSRLLRTLGTKKFVVQTLTPTPEDAKPWTHYNNEAGGGHTHYNNLYGFALSTGNEAPGVKLAVSDFHLFDATPTGTSGAAKCFNMPQGIERY